MSRKAIRSFSRRDFMKFGTALAGVAALHPMISIPAFGYKTPAGPAALPLHHFPNSLYAFVWRNWGLVPIQRMASTVGATENQLSALASAMGLPYAPVVSADQWERSYLTIIRRNWHLLPTEQLLRLLGWDQTRLDFTLKEDDFFFVKLGNLKPDCHPIDYQRQVLTDDPALTYLQRVISEEFPGGQPPQEEPYFQFVRDLSSPGKHRNMLPSAPGFSPRIAYPYFALMGDPLISGAADSYPDGYLAKMAASGVDHIWMHIVLTKLTPFPWDPAQSQHWETRLANLEKLTEKCRKHGIGIYLYLNEPRNQDEAFFRKHPHLRGHGNSLCTSVAEVRNYLRDSIALIMEKAPALAGFFSITASENPTNCWSHYHGHACPRCSTLGPAKVIAELNNCYLEGIRIGLERAKASTLVQAPRLIVWDWGWPTDWAEGIISRLDKSDSAFMSVSEWDLTIERGGVSSQVGEYSISAIGPGPRALKHWQIALDNEIPVVAKIQANNSWELGAVPYIPALYNVAEHVANLRETGVTGLMLGWSLGGYPSPNLEVASLLGSNKELGPEEAIESVAKSRYGAFAGDVTTAWRKYSNAFREFPYNGSLVYYAPIQSGPSNLLWPNPTGYSATMVGIAYDHLESWRAVYPVDVFIRQLRLVASGFEAATEDLKQATGYASNGKSEILHKDINIAETVACHYASAANQAEFIQLRDQLLREAPDNNHIIKQRIEQLLREEITLAKRMSALQRKDSRLGYEASNHYFYVPSDLDEKVLNCRYLLDRWLPTL